MINVVKGKFFVECEIFILLECEIIILLSWMLFVLNIVSLMEF